MVELFEVDRSVVAKHLKNIFQPGELTESSVCVKNAHTAAAGKTYSVTFYNLDAIISVGCRVHSLRVTDFRKWGDRHFAQLCYQGLCFA